MSVVLSVFGFFAFALFIWAEWVVNALGIHLRVEFRLAPARNRRCVLICIVIGDDVQQVLELDYAVGHDVLPVLVRGKCSMDLLWRGNW